MANTGGGGGKAHPASKPLRPTDEFNPPRTKVKTPPPAAPVYYTATQLLQMATKAAQDSQAPQMALYEQQRQQALDQARQEAAAIQGFAAARAKISAGLGPEIGANFTGAANSQATFGKGFSTDLQGKLDQSADQTNQYLQNVVGAPAGQNISPSFSQGAGNTLYALGGYLPATTFAQQGAAFKSAADMLPTTYMGLGGQDALQALLRGDSAVKDIYGKEDLLAAALPGLAQSAFGRLSTAQYQDKSLAQRAQAQRQNLALRTRAQDSTEAYRRMTELNRRAQIGLATKKEAYQEWLSQKKLGLAEQHESFSQWAKTQGLRFQGQRVQIAQGGLELRGQALNLQAQKFAVQTLNQDRNYRLALGRLGVSKRSLQLRIASQEYKLANNGFSKSQVQKFTGTAYTIAQNAYNGFTDSKGTKHPPLDYQAALVEGRKEGIPMSILMTNLDELYAPGERGRPSQPLSIAAQKAVAAATGGFGKTPPFRVEAGGSKLDKQAVSLVKQYLGDPYVWGGEQPGGFDCSGLLQYVWGKVGIQIPRTTYDQWKAGQDVTAGPLRPGDAVFFRGSDARGDLPGHVGFFIGDGKFIEAPHTGATVRISTLSGRSDYVGARRFG